MNTVATRPRLQTQPTCCSRLLDFLNGRLPSDRLPAIEWAPWWGKTLQRWRQEGLPADLDSAGIKRHLGLDVNHWYSHQSRPASMPYCAEGHIANRSDYENLRPELYPPFSAERQRQLIQWNREQQAGTSVVWFYIHGFFWWPRELLGITRHLYAFYDAPDLIHQINQDQADYVLRVLDWYDEIGVPDVVFFGEDIAGKAGSMISRELFQEFVAPYYRQVVPRVVELGMTPMVDSDGFIEEIIPWFQDVGIRGLSPQEVRAGNDVARIRRDHPDWLMVGGFDKNVIKHGEAAIRGEFERLLPVMRQGGFIPSVDHQTPPDATLAQYRTYAALLHEYAERAVQ